MIAPNVCAVNATRQTIRCTIVPNSGAISSAAVTRRPKCSRGLRTKIHASSSIANGNAQKPQPMMPHKKPAKPSMMTPSA